MRLKIGDFARLGQVTVQTLRHYDDLGLLGPAEVDSFTSYRYYTFEQLPRLHRILALKDFGLSLEQITQLLAQDLPPSELRGMLRLKQSELREQVRDQIDRLERIEARLRQIEQENETSPYEVVVRRVEPLLIASVRGFLPTYWDATPLWMELAEKMSRAGIAAAGPFFSIYHATEPQIDTEACVPVTPAACEQSTLQVYELPVVEQMACTIHHGPFTGLINGFTALFKWVDANGYQLAGPDREIYLRHPSKTDFANDTQAVTELQVPVSRVTT
jgi:DNA-binding transcriptional MerR regulator